MPGHPLLSILASRHLSLPLDFIRFILTWLGIQAEVRMVCLLFFFFVPVPVQLSGSCVRVFYASFFAISGPFGVSTFV